MTYFKCVTCKARLYSVANPDSLVRDLCPGCGAMLEPVGELAEVVGYRSIKLRDDSAQPQRGHGVVIDRFAEVLAGRRARSAQAALDAERWLDDGAIARPSCRLRADAPVLECVTREATGRGGFRR